MMFIGPLVLGAFGRLVKNICQRCRSLGLWPYGLFGFLAKGASVTVVVNWTYGPMGLVGPLANDQFGRRTS